MRGALSVPRATAAALLVLTSPALAAADTCTVSSVVIEVPDGRAALVATPPLAAAAVQARITNVVRHAPAAQASVSTPAAPAGATRPPPRLPARPAPANDQERLFYAIGDGDTAGVSRLLQAGTVDVNAPANARVDRKAIELAAMRAQPAIARDLIGHGARVKGIVGTQEVRPVALAMLNLKTTIEMHGNAAAFVYASERSPGDFEATLRVLLDAGADADGLLDPDHAQSALSVLVSTPHFEGDLRIARLLIEHGAHLGDDAPGGSPLTEAAARGRLDILDLAVDSGHLDRPALDAALAALIAVHDDARVAQVLAAGANPNAGTNGQPLLCSVVGAGAAEHGFVAQLLARGAQPNVDCPGGPPLLLAAGDDAIALALLAHGADPNRATRYDERILDRVADSDHALLDAILERGGTLGQPPEEMRQLGIWQVGSPGPLVRAILHRKDYLASALLRRDGLGSDSACAAVMYAAASGTSSTLAELLRRGGDPNATSERGISALMVAAYKGDDSSVAALLADRRVRVDRETPSVLNRGYFALYSEEAQPLRTGGRTALMYAAAAGHAGSVRLLLQHGASAHETDAEGWNALRYASTPQTRAALGGAR